jgi:DNA-binding transcriptional regulator of glucitol operon
VNQQIIIVIIIGIATVFLIWWAISAYAKVSSLANSSLCTVLPDWISQYFCQSGGFETGS